MKEHTREIRKKFPTTEPKEKGGPEQLRWLKSQQELYDAVLYHMVDAVIVTDHRGRVTLANHAAEGLLGRRLRELTSLHILDCFRDEDGTSVSWIGRQINRYERLENKRQIAVRPDGSIAPVLLSLVPILIDGILVRVIGIIRDQTEVERQNRKLMIANEDLEEANNKLEEIARTDEMTGLLNRRAFLERLHEYIALARRHGEALGLVYIDPNRFKPVNDTYGHKQGDAVIREVAARLRRALYSTDITTRYGGDEFIVMLPRTDSKQIMTPLEKIRRELRFSIDLRHPKTGLKNGVQITVAIGGAVRRGSRIPPAEDFIEKAEQTMYCSKKKESSYETDLED